MKRWTQSFPYNFQIGETIIGHVCHSCKSYADAPIMTNDNPRLTDWCMICGHRGEGYDATGKVANWFRIVPTTIK